MSTTKKLIQDRQIVEQLQAYQATYIRYVGAMQAAINANRDPVCDVKVVTAYREHINVKKCLDSEMHNIITALKQVA